MNDNKTYRKAAILISALDDETADLLLAELPSRLADAIRQEALELAEVDVHEQEAIIKEFMQADATSHNTDLPGLELTDELASKLTGSQSRSHVGQSSDFHDRSFLPHQGHELNTAPFQSLQTADASLLATALETEPPQIIGAVIASLPSHRAGDLLARLPSTVQAEVIRRLSTLEPASREVLGEIERLVLARIRQIEPVSRSAAGWAAVSTILSSADEAARRQILSNLARHDRQLAGKLATPATPAPRFTFDEVCNLATEGLLRVVQSAPLETVVLAFAGANADLVAELVDCLPPEESQRFARGIAELGPTRLADIEAAQTSLAELAARLSADGRLHGGPPIHLTAVA